MLLKPPFNVVVGFSFSGKVFNREQTKCVYQAGQYPASVFDVFDRNSVQDTSSSLVQRL